MSEGKPVCRSNSAVGLGPAMRKVRISAALMPAGNRAWNDSCAEPPDSDWLEMIEAAVRGGWCGITTFIDGGGLRCVAASDEQIAIVTLSGLTTEEADWIGNASLRLKEWNVAGFRALIEGLRPSGRAH